MATDYHVVTLPNKTKVPVRDHFLRDGRRFSVSGDLESNQINFDGSTDVNLVSTIGNGKVTLEKINESAIADDLSDVQPSDSRLTTAGAVIAELEDIYPKSVADEDIIALFH